MSVISDLIQRFNIPAQIKAVPSWIQQTYQNSQAPIIINKKTPVATPITPSSSPMQNSIPRQQTGWEPSTDGTFLPIFDKPAPMKYLTDTPSQRKQIPNTIQQPNPRPSPATMLVMGQSATSTPWGKTGEPDPNLVNNITAGYEKYKQSQNFQGTLPAQNLAPIFAEFAQRYPLYQQNPYLMPAVAIYETSGGLNVTRPNNLINYGVRLPVVQRIFSQPSMTMEEALRRSLYEMAKPGSPYAKYATGRPMTREELIRFAQQYEPNNGAYFGNLSGGLQEFWGVQPR